MHIQKKSIEKRKPTKQASIQSNQLCIDMSGQNKKQGSSSEYHNAKAERGGKDQDEGEEKTLL
jgi:hypothetical protein